MITALRGKIVDLQPLQLKIDVQGVTYLVHIPLFVYEKLSGTPRLESIDTEIRTRVIYSENDQSLYGFLTDAEAETFDFLRSLHGIGPRLVLSILSHLPAEDVLKHIEREEDSFLLKIPGIGKTKAQKVIFEGKQRRKKLADLKIRISGRQFSDDTETPAVAEQHEHTPENEILDTVESALFTLGFGAKEIEKASQKIESAFLKEGNPPPPLDREHTQTWIRLYLKFL